MIHLINGNSPNNDNDNNNQNNRRQTLSPFIKKSKLIQFYSHYTRIIVIIPKQLRVKAKQFLMAYYIGVIYE